MPAPVISSHPTLMTNLMWMHLQQWRAAMVILSPRLMMSQRNYALLGQ
jgi:hypothetical protein